MQKFVCLLIVLAVATQEISSTQVVCYFTNWAVYRNSIAKFQSSHIDPSLCTIINYAYLGLSGKTGEIFHLDPWSDISLGNMKNVTDMKKTNPSLKVLVSIGGWNAGSTNFSRVAGNATLRANFVNSALNFIKVNNFDGVDIDWDYPGKGDKLSESDPNNFINFMTEVKAAFKPKGYLLTAAVMGAGPKVDTSYNIKKLAKNVDYLNLVLFDLRIAPSCNYTAHHSPLYFCSLDVTAAEKELSVANGIQHWLKKGANVSQLILGVALYGRSFTLTNPKKHGLYAPSSGVGPSGPLTPDDGNISYQEICNYYGNYTKVWNVEQQAPHAYSGSVWFSYDDVTSVSLKTKYAVAKGMGGVMVWSLGHDDFNGSCGKGRYPLLKAINEALYL